jgi:N4-gp56 family major capsid protein
MPDTSVASANRVQQWADDEFYSYVRGNLFKPYMGKGENSIIQVKEELTKEAGDRITFSLVSKLTGSGVTDDAQLEGNEESLANYGHLVTVGQLRHGVVVGQFEKIKTKIDLLNAAKIMLRLWNMERLRDLFIARLLSPSTTGLTTYAAAAEVADKDAWEAANNPSDTNQRILFGAAKVHSTLDHSAGLNEIDGTADDLHQDIVRLAKRLAQSCDPAIRPVVASSGSEAGQERFVLFCGSIPFRDLEANFETVRSNADVRGDENGIFRGGDLKIGNVIVHEIPELDKFNTAGGSTLDNVGAGGIDVQATFLCGAQALLLAWAQRMQVKMDEFDYSNRRGVAVAEIRGCEKATYNGFQHGVVTSYVSAVGD